MLMYSNKNLRYTNKYKRVYDANSEKGRSHKAVRK